MGPDMSDVKDQMKKQQQDEEAQQKEQEQEAYKNFQIAKKSTYGQSNLGSNLGGGSSGTQSQTLGR